MSELTFEHLSAENAPALQAAHKEVLDHPVRADSLAAFLDDPRHFMILALRGGRCVGMASGFEYFHPDKEPQVFLNEIGVAEAEQNQGIGRTLVRQVLDEAARRGANYVWLGTEVDNFPAQTCFSKVDAGHAWVRDEGEGPRFAFYGWAEASAKR